jgi:transposase
VRATWAPRGKTPVLTHHFNWKRLSMSAAVGYSPDSSDAFLVYGMRSGSYNDESLIEFLEALRVELGGDKLTLIWDGLPSHRSKMMTAWIETQRSWLRVERLPPYGHDLNPVELIWGNLKSSELANYCPDTIDEAAAVADAGLQRIGGDAQLCFAFLRHTGLSL